MHSIGRIGNIGQIGIIGSQGNRAWLNDSPLLVELTTTAANQSITLPHLNTDYYQEVTYHYDYIVNWGDGSAEQAVTTYNHANRTHVYAVAGAYQVSIKGLCETFYIEGGALAPFVTKVIAWGNVGLKEISFQACANLTVLAGDGYGLRIAQYPLLRLL